MSACLGLQASQILLCGVCVYHFFPNPNLTGMADKAACLLLELAVLGQVPWPLAVFNQCVLTAALGDGSLLIQLAGGHFP